MGRRGPPPKPTALRVLGGNASKRPLPQNEPKPKPGTPPCPRWLLPEGKREFRRIVRELKPIPRLLTRLDGSALAAACQSWARYREAEDFLAKQGMTYVVKGDDGSPRYVAQFPQVSISRQSLYLYLRFCQEFGLTPAARARMAVPTGGASDDDEFEAFLGRGQKKA